MPFGITIRTPSPVLLQDNPFVPLLERSLGQETLAAGQIRLTPAQVSACNKWAAGRAADLAPNVARTILKTMLDYAEWSLDYVLAQEVLGNSEMLFIEEVVLAFEKHISSREEQFGADDARVIHSKVTFAGILLQGVCASCSVALEDDSSPWESIPVEQLSHRAWEALHQVLGLFFRESWVERLLPSPVSHTRVSYRDALWDDDCWVKTVIESYAKSPDLFQAAAWSMKLYFRTHEAFLYVTMIRAMKRGVRMGLLVEVDGATVEDLAKQGCTPSFESRDGKAVRGFVATDEYYRIYGINPQLLQKGEGEEEVGTSGSRMDEARPAMLLKLGDAQQRREMEKQEANKAYGQLQALMNSMRLQC